MTDLNITQLRQSWLNTLLQKGKSQHTITAYQNGVSHFIGWYEQTYQTCVDLKLVMPRDIRDWKGYQQSIEKAAPASINQRLVAVNRFFAWAVQSKLCSENPADDIGLTPLSVRQPQGLKGSELRRLLRAARASSRDYAMIEVLAGTGLRVSELLALHIGDLQMNERSGSVIVRQGKRDNYREIPLTADVRKAVAHYLDTEHPDSDNAQAPVWMGRRGQLTQRSSVKRMLEKYAQQAKLAPPSPHVLRHTFATRYLTANPGDIRGLARLLGHTSLNTVMIYTEPDMDTLAERMERVETVYE
ncbi:MAG: tyrosine-type recombinase/integrase [Aggregatilineales bacterium]